MPGKLKTTWVEITKLVDTTNDTLKCDDNGFPIRFVVYCKKLIQNGLYGVRIHGVKDDHLLRVQCPIPLLPSHFYMCLVGRKTVYPLAHKLRALDREESDDDAIFECDVSDRHYAIQFRNYDSENDDFFDGAVICSHYNQPFEPQKFILPKKELVKLGEEK